MGISSQSTAASGDGQGVTDRVHNGGVERSDVRAQIGLLHRLDVVEVHGAWSLHAVLDVEDDLAWNAAHAGMTSNSWWRTAWAPSPRR